MGWNMTDREETREKRHGSCHNSGFAAKVNSSMYHQCRSRGYAAPVDVLIDIGVLSKQKYDDWRFGRARYLEAVCEVNLHKLSMIMHQIRVYAMQNNLKPSYCFYKQWGTKKSGGQGKKNVIPLRFSKSGNEDIERWYSTHWVDSVRVEELKNERSELNNNQKDG